MHQSLKQAHPRRMPLLPESLQLVDRTYVRLGQRRLLYFAGCDYFRLSRSPEVLKALHQGVTTHGLSVSASRKTTGNHQLFGVLEKALATFFQSPTALLVGAGYMTNLVVAQALQGRFTHLLMDERAHPSLQDAALLFGAPVLSFRHRDSGHVAQLLKRCGTQAVPLLLTDGLFSHDGSLAPLDKYLALLPVQGQVLLDEAHAAGILGKNGRGTLEHFALPARRVIRTLTLSKAFGVYGGAILCGKEIRELILAKSRMFAGHTPLPLPLAQAAFASLRLLRSKPEMRRRLVVNTALAKSELRKAGLSIPDTPAPIISWIPEKPAQAARLKKLLLNAGIFPSFIQYPGGPEHGYFRFVLSSEHTPRQITKLVDCLKTV